MLSQEDIQNHRQAIEHLRKSIRSRKRSRRPVDIKRMADDQTALSVHTSAISNVKEDVDPQHLIETYNFSLYWAQKADDEGKQDIVRKHLRDALKSRLKFKKFNLEKNKVRLAKEMLLRKKYDLPLI